MSFEYFRRPRRTPFPRSLNTAIRAFRNRQVPLDVLVFRAGSVDTIGSRPLNVHLVQETMAASGLDPNENAAIARELFEQLGTEDLQLSDFCAQSLVRLEERYYTAIRDAESRIQKAKDDERERAAAQEATELYLNFAEVLTYNGALQRFYLNRCERVSARYKLPVQQARALLGLRHYDEAMRVLAGSSGTSGQPLDVALLLADAAFRRGDLETILTMVAEMKLRFPNSPMVNRLVDYWLGSSRPRSDRTKNEGQNRRDTEQNGRT